MNPTYKKNYRGIFEKRSSSGKFTNFYSEDADYLPRVCLNLCESVASRVKKNSTDVINTAVRIPAAFF